ncbi:hypothetical protein ACOQFB_00975 [Anaeromyxobacter sp. Red801]|uniref:hypothetical protein n=1 Tax=Anaeromyxobacter sp. Red801 TaxID=3411632 RepID=UPI003BA360D7
MPSDPAPDALFRCEALHCMLRQRVCVRRQVLAELDILGGSPTTRRSASVRHGGVSDVEALRGWAAERRMLAVLGEPPTIDMPPMRR